MNQKFKAGDRVKVVAASSPSFGQKGRVERYTNWLSCEAVVVQIGEVMKFFTENELEPETTTTSPCEPIIKALLTHMEGLASSVAALGHAGSCRPQRGCKPCADYLSAKIVLLRHGRFGAKEASNEVRLP